MRLPQAGGGAEADRQCIIKLKIVEHVKYKISTISTITKLVSLGSIHCTCLPDFGRYWGGAPEAYPCKSGQPCPET